MLDPFEAQGRTERVAAALVGLSAYEALRILHVVMGRFLTALWAGDPEPSLGRTQDFNDIGGHASIFDKDEEQRKFVHELLRQRVIAKEIAKACLEKFGPERAASKSQVDRERSRLKRDGGLR